MRLQEVIWPNKYILVGLGLWPMHPNAPLARQLFAHFRILVGLFSVNCLLVPEIMTIVIYWGDIDILGDFGSLIVINYQLTLKLLYYEWRRRKFRSVYQHLKDFWDFSVDPEERRHYEQLAKVAKLATIVFTAMCISNFLCFEATPLITWLKNRRDIKEGLRHRPLFLELYYPFDTQRTPIYEFVFTWQSFCSIYIVLLVAGFDSMLMVFIVHVSAQFRLIAARFRVMAHKINEQTIVEENPELRAEIGKLIAQHQHTIKVAEEMTSLLSPIMFGQIISSALEICTSGYVLIEGDGSFEKIVKFFVMFVSLLIELILWCAPAELLIQESTTIAVTIYYEVPWYTLSPSLRRDLAFIMMRSQKECHVTAMYQVMSIRRITEVVNAAGSYLALLRSMKK